MKTKLLQQQQPQKKTRTQLSEVSHHQQQQLSSSQKPADEREKIIKTEHELITAQATQNRRGRQRLLLGIRCEQRQLLQQAQQHLICLCVRAHRTHPSLIC
jgi:hypothetical protein